MKDKHTGNDSRLIPEILVPKVNPSMVEPSSIMFSSLMERPPLGTMTLPGRYMAVWWRWESDRGHWMHLAPGELGRQSPCDANRFSTCELDYHGFTQTGGDPEH